MSALSTSRLRLRAFESTRRPSWRVVPRQFLGVSVELLVLGLFVAGGWLERWLASRALQQMDESVGFLAPLRRAAPAPSEERLQFVGLGNATIATEGVRELPSDNGLKPVAMVPQGSRLIAEEESSLPESDSPRALTEIEVDSVAALSPDAVGPEYPPELMKAGVQGIVYTQFIVDSVGRADTVSMRVLETVEPQFVAAVKQALPNMKYKPAVFAGRRVSQLVQQAFVFRIKPSG